MSYVDEMLVIEIFRYAVAGPSAATHGQGEIQTIIERAAIAECVGLVNQNPNNV